MKVHGLKDLEPIQAVKAHYKGPERGVDYSNLARIAAKQGVDLLRKHFVVKSRLVETAEQIVAEED